MKQKLFLTSALAMGVIAPATAEPQRVETFPNAANNEFMQENKVYTNAATSTNMDGVYQDGATVNAVAQYTDILYDIVAGNYLAAGSDDVNGTQCPAGSYCPGLTDALYNATTDQGINSCSIATDGIYALSAAGSSSQNDCYRTCTTADVEHSAGVTGGYYYGNNNQCGATSCVNGWHLKTSMSGSELATAIGNAAGTEDYGYVDNSGQFHYNNENSGVVHDTAFFGLDTNNHNTWSVYYANDKGMLTGQGRCSTQAGVWSSSDITTFASLTDEAGQEGARYCYCNVTGYTPNGGTLQAVLSPWVFQGFSGDASGCANHCADSCTYSMRNTDSGSLAFRAALLGSVQPGLAMCEANVININWYNADASDISANNAGTATYGSDVRTPVKAQTIKGKTFKGWRFSAPEQTDLPE